MSLVRKLLKTAFPDAIPEIDLHGKRVPEALQTVAKAIETLERNGGGKLRIICGKGKGSKNGMGVLREAVGGWLTAHGRGNFTRNLEEDGLDGAITVEIEPG